MDFWHQLVSEKQIKEITEASFKRPQLIFKHSTSCGISAHAYYKLAQAASSMNESVDLHYLDLLAYRSISNKIAQDWGIRHQSPQVILLRDGKPIYNSSHNAIDPEKILNVA